ncbi:hypothetical protein ABPG72_006516 [Tetrahymena utriculariae]
MSLISVWRKDQSKISKYLRKSKKDKEAKTKIIQQDENASQLDIKNKNCYEKEIQIENLVQDKIQEEKGVDFILWTLYLILKMYTPSKLLIIKHLLNQQFKDTVPYNQGY